jgi:UDP-4-amino-4,6-dideoxy-N-acetyl-beta-L-altrosamine transaminase
VSGGLPALPYGRPVLDEDDVAAVSAVLRGEYLTTGPAVPAFEAAFAAAVGAPHAVACSSGTAALHMAALALWLREGEAMVVPSLTFLATANAARFVGAEVVFADVDPDTGLLGAAELEEALRRGRRVRAVAPVHLNGQSAEMPAIRALAAAHELVVMEDACHALGADCADETGSRVPVGACASAELAIFSTHPVKAIATGEGGIVTARDPQLARRLARLRNHGMVRAAEEFRHRDLAFAADGSANPWYYEMHEPGFNYRASDIHCALGLSQLKKLAGYVERRRALAARYDAVLAGLAPVLRPVPRVPWSRSAFHLYAVLIDFAAAGIGRAALMRALAAKGVGSQVHYLPVHRQPYYRDRYGALDLPGADRYYARVLSLPLFPAMADSDVERVADALAAAIPALRGTV